MKKPLLGLAVVLAVTGCATQRGDNQPLEVWQNFSESKINASQINEDKSLAVFYRQNDVNGPAVNIYVNGDYQASLLPNAYTSTMVCAGKSLFSSSFTSSSKFGNRTAGMQYNLPATKVSYIKVGQAANGKLTFTQMDAAIAEQEIAKLPRENQTLSRVATKDCNQPKLLETAVLDADALFAFNKSEYKDMLPKSKQRISEFAQKVNQMPGVASMTVIGHADPVGSAAYNKTLSQKRAESVKLSLQRSGVKVPISAEGYGSSAPIVTNCDQFKGAERNKCNLPNRRVEIAVYGN
ncbi:MULTISPECIES: OmpA family protein [Pasteurellaceae]|uniref:OmpA-like domain-containing protein n=1 Tax=Rodentibacter genomosp. 1 TaxID=1908264 RepID=A0A1V3J4F1_9PAST|nr:OmpA family protein [Rodentibacter genomosp. 1]MBF0751302.1 OmpA family protein [Pasteurella sp. 19428wF3_WM03]OOF49912.1 hypothetical protein BKK54_06870 [Rodentibacter genomosp. 1]TFU51925.1 OmpA family protein [Pasteurella sp. WM03]